MCKEMPVIPVNMVVNKKRIIRKNRWPKRRRGTRVAEPPKVCIKFTRYLHRYMYHSSPDSLLQFILFTCIHWADALIFFRIFIKTSMYVGKI
jgi:hypothetical protein